MNEALAWARWQASTAAAGKGTSRSPGGAAFPAGFTTALGRSPPQPTTATAAIRPTTPPNERTHQVRQSIAQESGLGFLEFPAVRLGASLSQSVVLV
jgi:hypothetical protein